jgi:hypothetical protein
MDSAQHCHDQAAECRRLMKKAQSKDEARALTNISYSWLRLAGQIDRYHAIVREQGRIVRRQPPAAMSESNARARHRN